MVGRLTAFAGGILVSAVCAAPVLAASRAFHTFVISELYSSVDGQVQFIELRESIGFDGEHFFAGHALTATSADGTQEHVFVFPTNLPNSSTANKSVLIATANFATLTGGVTPNYTIPPNFLFPGGEVNFAGLPGGATVTYTSLPSDGQQSRVYPGGTLAVNSPRNFANQTGSVNVPPGSCCVSTTCTVTTSLGCTGVFTSGGACTPDPCAPPSTGACCVGTVCSIQTSAACAGVFQGEGSVCGTVANPTTCCRANFNRVGGISVQDIFDFLAAYFGNDPAADINGSGGVSVQDIFDYLAAYFAGCAG
jgi:hypothetical protein